MLTAVMANVPVVSNPDPGSWELRGCRDSVSRACLLSGPLARAWFPRGATGAVAPSSGSSVCRIQCLL